MKKILFLLSAALFMIYVLAGCGVSGLLSGSIFGASFDKTQIGPDTVQANTGFAFDIFRKLNTEDGNKSIFISPLSISAALTMTYQGAGTTTKEAMGKTLGYEGIDMGEINKSYSNLLRYLKQVDKKVELNISNSIWIKQGEKIKEDFLKVNKEVFDATVSELDFSKPDSADTINKWISRSTKGKIDKMITPPISPDVVMYLINAIYFKGGWAERFDKDSTFNSQFHSGDGSISDVMMMSRKGKVEYGQGDGYKAVRLPYGNGKIAMYCVLPDENVSINDFIEDLDPGEWNIIKESISEREDVLLQLPRFKLEYGIKELKESLTELGMGEAFSESADFSGMREGVFISSVLHKAIIEVNEEGSEAAAATVVQLTKSAAPIESITFIADRPFMFVIEEEDTGTILFMGKLYAV